MIDTRLLGSLMPRIGRQTLVPRRLFGSALLLDLSAQTHVSTPRSTSDGFVRFLGDLGDTDLVPVPSRQRGIRVQSLVVRASGHLIRSTSLTSFRTTCIRYSRG